MKKLITLLSIISFFVLGLHFQTRAQTVSNTAYVGVWSGTDKSGVSYEITLNANWTCSCKINGVTIPDIVGYRIYGAASAVSLSPDQTIVKHNELPIKFFTQEAINGILCPTSNQQSTMGGSLSSMWDQTYNGTVKLNASLNQMTLSVSLNIPVCTLGAHTFSGTPLKLNK